MIVKVVVFVTLQVLAKRVHQHMKILVNYLILVLKDAALQVLGLKKNVSEMYPMSVNFGGKFLIVLLQMCVRMMLVRNKAHRPRQIVSYKHVQLLLIVLTLLISA